MVSEQLKAIIDMLNDQGQQTESKMIFFSHTKNIKPHTVAGVIPQMDIMIILREKL